MRVSGRFKSAEAACLEAEEAAAAMPFNPESVQFFGHPLPALAYAIATLEVHGWVLAVAPIPEAVHEAAGLPHGSGLALAWAVGLPGAIWGAFEEILANGVEVSGKGFEAAQFEGDNGGRDDLAWH